MIRILFMLFLLTSLLSCGTDNKSPHSSKYVTRVILNESHVDVKIRSYFNEIYGSKQSEKLLLSKSRIVESATFFFGEDAISGMESEMENINSIDSVIVYFGATKKAKHCSLVSADCMAKERNIIFHYKNSGNIDGYIKSDTAKETYIYTITEEDYQNAEPL